MPYQNPDDLTCRPVAFSCADADYTRLEKTFWVHHPWHLGSTKKIGELVVIETPTDTLIKIVLEPST